MESSPVDEWAELGHRLRQAREYLGLSQQYVADKTGIPRSAISDIERGSRKVDSLELRKFSRLFRYPVSYLLGEDATPDSPVQALARTMHDLTAEDLEEVSRYARYLRYAADEERRRSQR